MTKDGFESQCQIVRSLLIIMRLKISNVFFFQKNFLSPVLLTRSLLPYINTKTGRVLFASSSTMYTINDLNLSMPLKKYNHNGLDHYAYSKACVAQLVPRLAKTTPVKIYCKLTNIQY